MKPFILAIMGWWCGVSMGISQSFINVKVSLSTKENTRHGGTCKYRLEFDKATNSLLCHQGQASSM